MKNITIQSNISLKESMALLDKTAEKVLLVVDEEKKLIGTLTDGDIRRHILKGYSLKDTIENTYNKDPFFVKKGQYELEIVKKVFTDNKLNLIPILDYNKTVVDFLTWEKVFGNNKINEKQKIIAPVVIMAGGKGTRLEPFTKVLPKPLIPIGDKTIVETIIDRFRAYGISEFYLTINHMAKLMRTYFEENDSDYNVEFVEEDEFRGTAGSLKLLKDTLTTSFFVSNCDIIIEADYSDIFKFHEKGCYDITLVAATKQYNIPYGICELNNDGSLKTIKEKPEYNFLVNTGLYVVNQRIVGLIPDNGIFHITHLIEKVKENNGLVGVYPVGENSWKDVGQWAEYRKVLKVIGDI